MRLFSPALFLHYLVSAQFAAAALTTLWLSLTALLLGMTIGTLLALGREARFRAVRQFVTFYLWLFRGTPVLLQLVFAFNVLPSFGILLSGFTCAVLALGLNEGAYMAEIMRAGLLGVGRGQRLAARALGMDEFRIMLWVVMPQALRIIIPPIGNQFISMLKVTAIVSVIGVQDLLMVAEQDASGSFRYLETLFAAGVYYLVLTTIFMQVQMRIERRLSRRRRVVATAAAAPALQAAQ
jgi:polar amino acid transport system permease protein